MDEKTFLDSIFQSMQESEIQMQLLGRSSLRVTREQVMAQVTFLQNAEKNRL